MVHGRSEHEARGAFERAVEHERDAIQRHEAAARRQDTIAAQLEQHALNDRDDVLRDRALDNAAHARARADSARERARHARDRLIEESIDPDGTGERGPVGLNAPRRIDRQAAPDLVKHARLTSRRART